MARSANSLGMLLKFILLPYHFCDLYVYEYSIVMYMCIAYYIAHEIFVADSHSLRESMYASTPLLPLPSSFHRLS